MYHVVYKDSAGENTMSKCQRTEENTRKVCALLYYIHTTTYNRINYNNPCVLAMKFYRLVWFHTRRRFRTSISVRVSDSGHPITQARRFCTKTPGHKIYHCISVCSTLHHTLLHNPTTLHTKTFFAPDFPLCQIILSETKLSHSSLIHTCSPHTS